MEPLRVCFLGLQRLWNAGEGHQTVGVADRKRSTGIEIAVNIHIMQSGRKITSANLVLLPVSEHVTLLM